MKTPVLITSAVVLALQGCATTPDNKTAAADMDLSQSLPAPAAGIPASPIRYSSAQEAAKALQGYNYALTTQADGSVEAIVTGLVGSGAENTITQLPDTKAKASSNLMAELATEDSEMTFPEVSLTEKKNGQAAIDALGDKLPAVAQSYGMSPERLESILRTDSTAWVDTKGRLLYIDTQNTAPKPPEEAAAPVTSSITTATPVDTTDAFALHSKPGSNRLIYLDFNGHAAVNTAWYAGSLNAQAYDTDGNPAAFSDAELSNIKQIWQRVSEDYAPFDVDVTTQEPTAAALQRTSSTDLQYGTRAVITRSMPELCGQACGGVAYVGVYSNYSASTPDYYQPAWVFFDKLGGGYPKYVAEAASHEIGHNLNLNHDGNASTGYYGGHGNWAPIMGVGYYLPLTQWSKGEYPGANNLEDDIAIIHASGANLRADDYANTSSGSTVLGNTDGVIAQTGLIETRTDVDTFAFSTAGGSAQITVSPDNLSPNLDVQLKVTDAKGIVVAVANPLDSFAATVNTTLAAGQYFLQVDGLGAGDLTTGYSDYGSLGQYQVSGNFVPGGSTALPPSAIVSALPSTGNAPLTVQLNGGNSSDSDGTITAYNWTFGDGSTGSGSAISHIYQTVGNYTATLSVTDNSGLISSTTQAIQVTQSPVSTSMKASSTSLTRKVTSTSSNCIANVTLKYGTSTVPSATVSGTWSGSVTSGTKTTTLSGTGKVLTNKSGVASFNSPAIPKTSKGTCTFTVTGATKTGYTYEGNGVITGSYRW